LYDFGLVKVNLYELDVISVQI